jgi:ankyrin repeat protein
MEEQDSSAAAWHAAEMAIVGGDLPTLERLLREHEEMFRRDRPQSSWLGGLSPDYSSADARSIIAINNEFENWDQFEAHAAAAKDGGSPVARFESAVDAIVSGDNDFLRRLLQQDPDLVYARSSRRHRSTLLHYVGANGVEGFRQRTPKNAVEIAETLLSAGADVDAVAEMYGGGSTTLGLVATSIHPKNAGVQRALIDVLLAHGARATGGAGNAHQLVNGCLANGRQDAAEHLASRGAPLDLEAAAGVGRLDVVKSFFNPDGSLKPGSTPAQMKDGFTWACAYGRTDIVEYLVERGIDGGELLPRPFGQTGLQWAAHGGHVDTVRALLKRHPPLDVADSTFGATALGWALHGFLTGQPESSGRDSYYEVVALLVAAGATVQSEWLTRDCPDDPRMVAALTRRDD